MDTYSQPLEDEREASRAAPAVASRGVSRPLLTVHIAGSVAIVGADAVLLLLGISGALGAEPQTVYPAMALIATWIMVPLGVLALVSGVLLAVLGRWGLFRRAWIVVKASITAALVLALVVVLVPALGRAGEAATSPGAAEALTDAVRLGYAIIPGITLSLLVLNVALGVYKPNRRGRRRRSPAA